MPPALLKPVRFVDRALDELRDFPEEPRTAAGHQLMRVQNGDPPDDFKYLTTVGAGVAEIRIRDDSETYRVIYVAKFAEAVYVLHAFHKKAKKGIRTPKKHSDLAKARYKKLIQDRKTDA